MGVPRWLQNGLASRFVRGLVLGVLAAAAVWAAVEWTRSKSESGKSVARQWNEAINELGIEPVFPPEEDISVGDVFAVITEDALDKAGVKSDNRANTTIRLWHVDLTAALSKDYGNAYLFPEPGKPSAPQTGNASGGEPMPAIFSNTSPRTYLPIALFPTFKLHSSRDAKFQGTFNFGLAGMLGLKSDSDQTIGVSIDGAETYGVDSVVAENALVGFCKTTFPILCTETAVRRELSNIVGAQIFDVVSDSADKKRYRYSVELGLVNRVFLTRSIQTQVLSNDATSIDVNSSPARKKQETQPAPSQANNDAVAGQAPRLSNLPLSFNGGGLGSAENSSISSDGKPLDRPIVFGYKSVRRVPDAQ